jgi:hypothetical protein
MAERFHIRPGSALVLPNETKLPRTGGGPNSQGTGGPHYNNLQSGAANLDRGLSRNPPKITDISETGRTPPSSQGTASVAKPALKQIPKLFAEATGHNARSIGLAVIRLEWMLSAIDPTGMDEAMLEQIRSSLKAFIDRWVETRRAGPVTIDVPRDPIMTVRGTVNAFDSATFVKAFKYLFNDAPAKLGVAQRHHADAAVVTMMEDLRRGVGADDTERIEITIRG